MKDEAMDDACKVTGKRDEMEFEFVLSRLMARLEM
jgi:hypothetical protein